VLVVAAPSLQSQFFTISLAYKQLVCNPIVMKRIPFLFALFFITTPARPWLLDPATVRLANESPIPLYAALYYTRGTTGTRAAGPYYLPSQNAVHLELPSPQFLSLRHLCITLNAEELAPIKDMRTAAKATLGLFKPTDYTAVINQIEGAPQLFDTATWKMYAPPTSYVPATLMHTKHPAEEEFIKERFAQTKHAQEAYCSHPLSRPLSIGLCASGGGFRAMLTLAGVMCGLEKTGILPLMQTCLGLSGTTWFLFPWALSGLPPTAYTDKLVQWLWQGLIHHLAEQYHDFATLMATKKSHRLSVSGIDLYGISLGYTLLKPLHNNALELTMQDVAKAITPAQSPLVLGTAVTRPQPSASYEWAVVSPFALEFLNDRLSLPIHLFGAQFHTYKQLSCPPPPSLCYLLGVFGSSFSISIRDALERIPERLKPLVESVAPHNWHTKNWSNTKITAAKIANPRFKAPDSPHAAIKNIALVDGGYLNNLSLEPAVRVATTPYDLLFVIDCKQERPGRLRSLKNGWAAARETAPWLPEINADSIMDKPFSIHGDPATGATIVYCTVEGDPEYDPFFNPAADPDYATPRLIYPAERAERLVRYMEHIIEAHEPVLRAIITTLADQQKPG